MLALAEAFAAAAIVVDGSLWICHNSNETVEAVGIFAAVYLADHPRLDDLSATVWRGVETAHLDETRVQQIVTQTMTQYKELGSTG